MARLIDADALLKKMKQTSKYFDVKFDIEQAPTVDAVEVVRCGECRWASDYGEKYLYCQMNRDVNGDCRAVSKHGFCSYGERKENT